MSETGRNVQVKLDVTPAGECLFLVEAPTPTALLKSQTDFCLSFFNVYGFNQDVTTSFGSN